MPIKVTCQCGVSFTAKDEFLGKRVRCPKCSNLLTIQAAADGPLDILSMTEEPPAPKASHSQSDFGWDSPPAAKASHSTGVSQSAHGLTKKKPVSANAREWVVTDTGLSISFLALIIGGVSFAIIAILSIAMLDGPGGIAGMMSKGGGFLGILLIWSGVVLGFSFASLVTGWLVCSAVPRESKSRPMAQAAAGAVGVSFALVLLLQLVMLAMVPSPGASNTNNITRPRSPADFKKFEEDMKRAAESAESTAKIMRYVDTTFTWLSLVAMVASTAAFAWFLGMLGEYLGEGRVKQFAIYVCIMEGVFAVWLTLLSFLIEPKSLAMARLCMMLSIAFVLATYGGLIYLTNETRRLVTKQVQACL